MGCWCEGFDLSFTGHLTWVSNTGFRYMNFYLNPFHAYAVLGFFLTAMVLAMHGSAILGTYNTDKDPNVEMRREDSFWRDYVGYSIGEYGIHRLGFYLAVYTLIMSDLCILTSGTLVKDWVDFWHPFRWRRYFRVRSNQSRKPNRASSTTPICSAYGSAHRSAWIF